VLGEPLRPGLPGGFEAVLFHQPVAVVGVHKESDRLHHLLKVLEPPAIDDLLFKGPDKAFRHAIGLGLFDKGDAGVDAPVFKLGLEMIRGIQSQPANGLSCRGHPGVTGPQEGIWRPATPQTEWLSPCFPGPLMAVREGLRLYFFGGATGAKFSLPGEPTIS
jgi:hypothetical protein